jgi:hypothetical protein
MTSHWLHYPVLCSNNGGSTCIDDAFINLFCQMFGDDVMRDFAAHYSSQMIRFVRDFIIAKQSLAGVGVRFGLPTGLGKHVGIRSGAGRPWTERLNQFTSSQSFTPETQNKAAWDGFSFDDDNNEVVLTEEAMEALVRPVVQITIDTLRKPPLSHNLPKCKTHFLVGGFSESRVLRYISAS